MRAFVTGASGFLGSAVVGAVVTRGHHVTRLVRHDDGFRHPLVRDAHGDVGYPSTWESALSECDLVIHLAAAKGGDFSTQFASTVLGTEALLDAMQRVGINRLIHISSFSVYDYASLGVNDVLDERSPLEGNPLDRDAYAQTKLIQEQLVRDFAAMGGAVTIVRPGGVYGVGNLWNGGMAMVLPGGMGVAYAPFGRQKLTYVDNCAEAIALAAERRSSVGAVINIVDDDPPTQRAFARAMRRNGLSLPRCVVVPYRVAIACARILHLANRVLFRGRAKLPGVIVPAKLDAQFKPLQYPNAVAHNVLGWRPRYSLDEALRRCRTSLDVHAPVARDPEAATC